MSDATSERDRPNWPECCGFMQLFRAFKLAVHPTKLILAFCGVFGTYLGGRILDGVWSESSKPVVTSVDTELDHYVRGAGRVGTRNWIKDMGAQATHVGAFSLLMQHGRSSVNDVASAVLALSPGGVIGGVANGLHGLAWLAALHPWYAATFLLVSLLIWAVFGGAVCRVAAMHAARDERISMTDALKFARSKLGSFFAAPLMPLGIVVFFGLLLFLGGMIGAIPAIGEVLVGLLFFLALIAGFIIAFVIIGAIAGYAMMFPTIAIEGSDAFDALSRTFSYVYQRPWRTLFYYFVTIGYGAICLLFVKFFVRLMLWATHFFVALSMNWGTPFTAHPSAAPPKLDAIWQTPSLSTLTPFYGTFDESYRLTGVSLFGQFLIKIWIYLLYGFVAAFFVSLFYSASTLVYLLLRREVDATDLEDVYLEDAMDEVPVSKPSGAGSPPSAPAAAPPDAPGTSLPIIGQGN